MYNIHLYILDVVKLNTITIDVHRQRVTKKERPKEDEIYDIHIIVYVYRGSCRVDKNKTFILLRVALLRMRIRYSRVNIHIFIGNILIIQGTNEVRERACFRSSEGCAKWAHCGRKSCSTMIMTTISSRVRSRHEYTNHSFPVQLVSRAAVPSKDEPCLTRRYSQFL